MVEWLRAVPWVDPGMVVASPPIDQHKDLGRAVAAALARLPGLSENEWILHIIERFSPSGGLPANIQLMAERLFR